MISTASSAMSRWPRLTSSMAVSLLPTPLSPVKSMPSPYTSIITPCRIMRGPRYTLSVAMSSASKTEVSISVVRSVTPYFCAISMHSGYTSMPWQMMSAGISRLSSISKHFLRSTEGSVFRYIVSTMPMI